MAPKKGDKDQRPAIESDLWKLAGIGDVAGIKALVEREKDPLDLNSKDKYGCEPLIWAARNGRLEAVCYLLDNGADIESQGFGGMTSLHHAFNQLHEVIFLELLKRGANANATDDAGNTALFFAAERGVLKPVETLIESGASINHENNSKATPLLKATNDGHASVVSTLIEKGADVNAQDSKGDSALHIAARNGFGGIVSFLLNSHANVKMKNKAGKTPAELGGPALAKLFEAEE